ncbi:MAG: hypothetical protein LBE82_04675 [Chitinophagaceae bacterium]|nr:hypothetical protein [Chitinophagaceae bacterium]
MKYKTLSLENLGTFTYDSTGNDISFVSNKRIATTPELIRFIAESEKRSPILVKNDLNYFFDEARELMNIGARPLIMDDMGYLYFDKEKGYVFSKEPLTPLKEKENQMTMVGTDAFSPTTFYSNDYTSDTKRTGINIFSAILILLIIGGLGYGVYYFLSYRGQKERNNNADTPHTAINTDTVQRKKPEEVIKSSIDTAKQAPPPVTVKTNANNNSAFYKFVFEITPHASRAYLRSSKLKEYGNQVLVDTIQSAAGLQYKLYIPMKKEGLDTARAKDSLHTYFQKDITIE